MKKLLLAVAAASLVAVGACAGDEAKALFEAKCASCHSLEKSLHAPKDRAGWETTVKRMQKRAGNTISDGDVKTIVDYLVKVAPPK